MIRSDENIEISGFDEGTQCVLSCFFSSPEDLNMEIGHPFFQFSLPVVADSERANDEMLTCDIMLLFEISKVRDGLDGFSETHVISKDTVHFFVSQFDHPDQSLLLVIFELTAFEILRLYCSEGFFEFVQLVLVLNFSVDAYRNFFK